MTSRIVVNHINKNNKNVKQQQQDEEIQMGLIVSSSSSTPITNLVEDRKVTTKRNNRITDYEPTIQQQQQQQEQQESIVHQLMSHVSNRITPRGRPVLISNNNDDDDNDDNIDNNNNEINNNNDDYDEEKNNNNDRTTTTLQLEEQQYSRRSMLWGIIISVTTILYIGYIISLLQCWIISNDVWMESTVTIVMNGWYKTLAGQSIVIINKVSFFTLLSNMLSTSSLFAVIVALLLLWTSSFLFPILFLLYYPLWIIRYYYNQSKHSGYNNLNSNTESSGLFVIDQTMIQPPNGYTLMKLLPLIEILFRSSMIIIFVFLVWCTVLNKLTTTTTFMMSVSTTTIFQSNFTYYIISITFGLIIIVLLRFLTTTTTRTTTKPILLEKSTATTTSNPSNNSSSRGRMNEINRVMDGSDSYNNDNDDDDDDETNEISRNNYYNDPIKLSPRQLLIVYRIAGLSLILLLPILIFPWFQIRSYGMLSNGETNHFTYYLWHIPKLLQISVGTKKTTTSSWSTIVLVMFIIVLPIITHILTLAVWMTRKLIVQNQSVQSIRYHKLWKQLRYWLYILHPIANGTLIFGIALFVTLYTLQPLSTTFIDDIPSQISSSEEDTTTNSTAIISTTTNTTITSNDNNIWLFNNYFSFLPVSFRADDSLLAVQGLFNIGGWSYLLYGICTELLIILTLRWN